MSKIKLKKPQIDTGEQPTVSQSHFIAEGDRRPDNGKALLCSFRLPPSYVALLEDEVMRSGQNKTAILKAALLAFSEADVNEKNRLLLNSVKAL